ASSFRKQKEILSKQQINQLTDCPFKLHYNDNAFNKFANQGVLTLRLSSTCIKVGLFCNQSFFGFC
ncbi:hypothetical protein, partial [Parageobacillus thermoglucosidasius]|uniref:hypothetical protein n=1 Tax=Parageobacillus thermoglucosidasius TaxID=1426 RepID=UPI002431D670